MEKFLIYSKKIVTLFLIVLLFSSCTKWLDISPEKDLIKNNFWNKTQDANSALAGTYSAFRDAALESFVFGELRADIVTGFPKNFGPIGTSDIDPTNDAIDWSAYYKTINLANTLMYYDKTVMANDKSFTQKMKDGIDAEALFLRSLSYFYLVRLWKNAPLVTNPSISDTSNIYPINYDSKYLISHDPKYLDTEPIIIKQIKHDLLIAKDIAYTTEFQSNTAYFKGRANKYSIMTLLADVYLWNQQYDSCIYYCNAVINSGLYSLEPFGTWFKLYNPGNSNESIFELQFKDDGTNDQINPMFRSDLAYNDYASALINLVAGTTSILPRPIYANLFPDLTDVRACNGYNPVWKYAGVTLESTVERSNVSQRDAHIIYYRYADILLMKAEALNELPNNPKTLEANLWVTQTAERAGLQPISGITDQIEMRNAILNERAKEFVLEGKRWFDLLRAAKRNHFQNRKYVTDAILNKATIRNQGILGSKVNDTMMYYLPVPYLELTRNKNLKQNSFYER
jgi:hypothetical protein